MKKGRSVNSNDLPGGTHTQARAIPNPRFFCPFRAVLELSLEGFILQHIRHCTRLCLFLIGDLSFWALKICWNWRVTSGTQVVTSGRGRLRNCQPRVWEISAQPCPFILLATCCLLGLGIGTMPPRKPSLSLLHPKTDLGEPSLCCRTLLLTAAQHGAPGQEV